jgi:hypothetical protein
VGEKEIFMIQVHHQPSLAADLFNLWRLPFELAAEWALASAEAVTQGQPPRCAHEAQLPIPNAIEEAGEHNLFA